MKYNTTFFIESVVPDLVEHVWTTQYHRIAEKVRQLLLQQIPVEPLPQLTVQTYIPSGRCFIEQKWV
jgi:hypothetical protein